MDSFRHSLRVGSRLLAAGANTGFKTTCGWARRWPLGFSLCVGETVLLILCVSVPRRASLNPVGTEVVAAWKLLESTPSGRELLARVERSARGRCIYLTLGDRERDALFDEAGREVRGLTRAQYENDGRSCKVARIAVITNRDHTGSEPVNIAMSLAFELENVYYLCRGRCPCPGIDSPRAAYTRQIIAEELGM